MRGRGEGLGRRRLERKRPVCDRSLRKVGNKRERRRGVRGASRRRRRASMEVPGEGRGIEGVSSVHEMVTTGKGDGDSGAIRSDSGLGMVGRSGRGSTGSPGTLGVLGLLGAAGSRPGTPGCGSTRPSEDCGRLTMNGRGWGTEVGRRGLGAAWDVFSRSGECVQFSGGCVQFLAECVQFRGECVHFGGGGVQFWVGRPGWGWGADGRRGSSFGKLRTGRFGRLRTGFGGSGQADSAGLP